MINWWRTRPLFTSWLLLAVGMVTIVLLSSREVAMTLSQRFWLVAATTLLAALCIWIVSWEDGPEDGESEPPD